MSAYDFKEARKRQEKLKNIYRSMKKQFEDDNTWYWWLLDQIHEIDKEIDEAMQRVNAKIAPARNSGYPIMHFGNLIKPIIPYWSGSINKGAEKGAQ